MAAAGAGNAAAIVPGLVYVSSNLQTGTIDVELTEAGARQRSHDFSFHDDNLDSVHTTVRIDPDGMWTVRIEPTISPAAGAMDGYLVWEATMGGAAGGGGQITRAYPAKGHGKGGGKGMGGGGMGGDMGGGMGGGNGNMGGGKGGAKGGGDGPAIAAQDIITHPLFHELLRRDQQEQMHRHAEQLQEALQ